QAFATATLTVTHRVMAGRPMPLKKPSSDHKAMPSDPPSMRGNQYCRASPRVSGGMWKGANIQRPARLSSTNKGKVNSAAQRAVHVACDARVYRRPPKACATE